MSNKLDYLSLITFPRYHLLEAFDTRNKEPDPTYLPLSAFVEDSVSLAHCLRIKQSIADIKARYVSLRGWGMGVDETHTCRACTSWQANSLSLALLLYLGHLQHWRHIRYFIK